MKLSAAQIEQAAVQLEADAIPAEHPSLPKLERMFGAHTFFINHRGLNIVEPVESPDGPGLRGVVVNVARWTDAKAEQLQAHGPEVTDQVVDLEPDHLH